MSYPGRSHQGVILVTTNDEKSADTIVGGNTEGLNSSSVTELSVMLNSQRDENSPILGMTLGEG